jgi:hypothetical protein
MNHCVINITLGEELFQFATFNDWVSSATRRFAASGHRSENIICIDNKGRICRIGKHMMKARDENAFPITAHLIRVDP